MPYDVTVPSQWIGPEIENGMPPPGGYKANPDRRLASTLVHHIATLNCEAAEALALFQTNGSSMAAKSFVTTSANMIKALRSLAGFVAEHLKDEGNVAAIGDAADRLEAALPTAIPLRDSIMHADERAMAQAWKKPVPNVEPIVYFGVIEGDEFVTMLGDGSNGRLLINDAAMVQINAAAQAAVAAMVWDRNGIAITYRPNL